MTIDPAEITDHVERVRSRITRAGGDPDAITLVTVTKGFGADVVRAALAAGLTDLGENYAQELTAKQAELDEEPDPHGRFPSWHFLGRLQSNKVRTLAPLVTLWQSIDRAELIDELALRAPGASILVQINLSGEEQKGGCPFAHAPELVAWARERGLGVRGLMGVAPAGAPEEARPGFRRLVALADELDLAVRSIGMSADLEVAVEEGTTMVRIGTDLFGPRPPRSGG